MSGLFDVSKEIIPVTGASRYMSGSVVTVDRGFLLGRGGIFAEHYIQSSFRDAPLGAGPESITPCILVRH
jgi:hypothetical protein